MCDFKPGDEVVCVKTQPVFQGFGGYSVEGQTYTVSGVMVRGRRVALMLAGVENGTQRGAPWFWGHSSTRFRKVQRRNSRLTLEAFFTVPGGFEEPKRAPAKKRERV